MTDVTLFARLRELAGAKSVAVSIALPTTVAELRRRLAADYPALAALAARSAVAVNADLASDETLIRTGDEVALLPPVSGG